MTTIYNTRHLKYISSRKTFKQTLLLLHTYTIPTISSISYPIIFLSVESQLSKLTFLGKNARTDYQWECKHFAKQFGTMSQSIIFDSVLKVCIPLHPQTSCMGILPKEISKNLHRNSHNSKVFSEKLVKIFKSWKKQNLPLKKKNSKII